MCLGLSSLSVYINTTILKTYQSPQYLKSLHQACINFYFPKDLFIFFYFDFSFCYVILMWSCNDDYVYNLVNLI
ncbi:hypothetical protein HanPI659440_Chr03g0115171 [Helianthus annuus]|nr:hypothetical protein HanPI659440_Chr03g0115171 [Helianthus annuus]